MLKTDRSLVNTKFAFLEPAVQQKKVDGRSFFIQRYPHQTLKSTQSVFFSYRLTQDHHPNQLIIREMASKCLSWSWSKLGHATRGRPSPPGSLCPARLRVVRRVGGATAPRLVLCRALRQLQRGGTVVAAPQRRAAKFSQGRTRSGGGLSCFPGRSADSVWGLVMVNDF